MCWNLLFIFIFWRVIRWILGELFHIIILIPIFITHLFQFTARQDIVAHRPRNTLSDTIIGWSTMGVCFLASIMASTSEIRLILFIVSAIVFLLMTTNHFYPLEWFTQQNIRLNTPQETKAYTIRSTLQQNWSQQKAIHIARQLTAICPSIILTIEADPVSIYFRVIDPIGYRQDTVTNIFHSVYPDLDIEVTGIADWPSHPNIKRRTLFSKSFQSFALPLQDVPATVDLDPLMVLSQIANELEPGERFSMVLALGNESSVAQREGLRQVTQNAASFWMLLTRQGSTEHLRRLLNQENRVPRSDDFNMRLVDTKLRSRMFHVALWIQVQSTDTNRIHYLTDLAQSYFRSLSDLPYNQLDIASQLNGVLSNLVPDIYTFYRSWLTGKGAIVPPTLVLNHLEIASFWHLPHSNVIASRIQRIPKWLSISEDMAIQRSGTRLGFARYHHKWIDAYLETEMRRLHVNIIGQTGVGKSTLMFHSIVQDIQNGDGVAVLDPHGVLVEYLLMSGVLMGREHDVVVVDLNDTDYPAPLNPFALRKTPDAVLRVIHIIESLFEGTDQAVQTSSFLRAALMLLSEQDDVTMKDVAYLFLDEDYREDLLSTTTDPDIHLYMNKQYHKGKPSYQANIANPIHNRIRPFFANLILYLMVCHPKSLNFAELMSQNKIILISLNTDSERVPMQERHLLGTLIMSELQRSGMRGSRQNPYYLYVDEMQHFITTSLDIVFAEARKNGLALTTANQYLGQLKGQTREAMLGNAGTNIVFRVGPDDVSTLAARTKPEFTEHDLLNLDAYTAAVKTQFQTRTQPAFTLRTNPLPPLPPNAKDIAKHIRQLSRQQHTPLSQTEVLDWLDQRYQNRPNPVNLFP